MNHFKLFGNFQVAKEQRDQFLQSGLWQRWLEEYPMIFDQDDKRVVTDNAHRGYYFYEWLAAILIYHTTGYLSLVDHYQYHKHTRKNAIFRELVGEELTQVAWRSKTWCPDLLVYKPDKSNWYFVEVKGHGDKLRENQIGFFNTLQQLSGKPVYVIQFALQGYSGSPPVPRE